MNASWGVVYYDGSMLSQFDKASSNFMPEAGEVPYRAIEWEKVKSIKFSSQLAETNFDMGPIPTGNRMTLRSRHFKTLSGANVMCFMLVLSDSEAEEVDSNSARSILYVFPDGTTHECENFNCPDIAEYGHRALRDEPVSIMPATHTLKTEVQAVAI